CHALCDAALPAVREGTVPRRAVVVPLPAALAGTPLLKVHRPAASRTAQHVGHKWRARAHLPDAFHSHTPIEAALDLIERGAIHQPWVLTLRVDDGPVIPVPLAAVQLAPFDLPKLR